MKFWLIINPLKPAASLHNKIFNDIKPLKSKIAYKYSALREYGEYLEALEKSIVCFVESRKISKIL